MRLIKLSELYQSPSFCMPNNPLTFSKKLLQWFDHSGRHDLPWQENKTPYRVWVSEIMLQQTQVQTVIPYYQRFIKRFPTVFDLAKASQDEVLAHWSGLGYYARGRNLHKAAQIIVKDFDGQFPEHFDEMISLPGIGRSTAGAILSISVKKRYPILDGNVKRVLSRFDAVENWTGEKQTEARLWNRAEELTPQNRFGDYTQAIMDLGATVCTRSRPKCEICPVQDNCQAWQQDRVKDFPFSKPKKAKPTRKHWFLIVFDQGELFLVKRPQKGIWGGLWSLPQFETESALLKELEIPVKNEDESTLEAMSDLLKWPEFTHSFTHYHLQLQPVQLGSFLKLDMEGDWFDIPTALALGLPAPIRKIVKALEKNDV